MGPVSGTLVSFHAHPDDECISTGGTIAKSAAEGHRVVVVFATGGEHGEVNDGVLADGESLGDRRLLETQRAAEILGVARVEFLGYVDSGMDGTPENDADGSFWSADLDEAAEQLALILREEDASVLTVYDERGGYGHPDHIQVHRVGVRAAQLAGTPRVYEATINRDAARRAIAERLDDARAAGVELPDGFEDPESFDIGVPESVITTEVDVSAYVDAKRAALAAHASQVDEASWFLAMPADSFRQFFGQEWFIRRGAAPGPSLEQSLWGD
jgi:LmbE family N-acetylglucosaminyl deacetylase